MENIELYKREINKKIEDVILKEDEVYFILDDSKIELGFYHSQDCCEHVWADFDVIKYHKEEIIGKRFGSLIIKGVKDIGFLLCFDSRVKIFIPCYNEQNGYYSSDLSLEIKIGEVKTSIDISGLVEDNID